LSTVSYSAQALRDLQRLAEFLLERDPSVASETVEIIVEAIEILERHPEIGRKVGNGSTGRELIISRGRSGYIALYRFNPVQDRVLIIAIRHQRESGYQSN
jgi:addiction module RelE/StbE family toxin